MLLGLATMPAFATSAPQAADASPQPRLRLATVLASLHQSRESGGEVPPTASGNIDIAPAAPEQTPLALNWTYQLPGLSAAKPAAVSRDSSADRKTSAPVPPPERPTPSDKPGNDDDAPIPVRRSASADSRSRDALVEASRKPENATRTSAEPATLPKLAATDTASSTQSSGTDAKVVGDEEFLPAEESTIESTVADLPVPSRSRSSPTSNLPSPSQKRWGAAPIRWGGIVSVGLRRSTSDTSSGSSSQVYEGRLRANSYIWKPYIALVSGDFALTSIRSQESGDVSSSNLVGTSVTGSGTLQLFPQSRFPFSASLTLSDSRSEGSFSDSNIQQKRLSLRQDYRPQTGRWSSSAGYDRSELTGDFGSDVVDRVFGNFSNSLERHSINLTGDFSRNQAAEQTGRSYFLGANHGFTYSDELSLSTNASLTGQQFDLDTDSATTQSLQVFSYGNWTPSESKWRGSANLRYFQTNNTVGGTTFENRTIGGAASLNYQASRNLNVFGSAGLSADNDNKLTSNQSLGLSYSGDPLRFGYYDYTWFTSASVSNATSGEGDSFRSLNGSVGHSLMRTWQTSEQTTLSGSVNQSVSSSRSTGIGSSSATTLSHGASIGIQANSGETLTGYLSASASDSRTTGDTTSSFQMLNVQLTGNWRINQYSEVDSNLTWQWTRQESENDQPVVLIDEFGRPLIRDDTSRTGNTSLAGGVGYSHRRALGLRGLRYRLDFRANTNRDDSRRFGNPNALRQQDRATLDLDQRLYYRIGRLDTELQYRIAEIEGRRNQLVFFRVSREFGSF
ncbi:hypothetical protein [Aromatoleum petrolei]|uniref:hypothetical protein n=1 Tax=Aromatoleum petrolei TaxID=76116 RepID=UPI001BB78EA5|nr:hypothetical protein [Aromatoleum petrolei]QTQ36953.1 Uncharacterized protein ToN1_28180 [Aromatoleum petrolei]